MVVAPVLGDEAGGRAFSAGDFEHAHALRLRVARVITAFIGRGPLRMSDRVTRYAIIVHRLLAIVAGGELQFISRNGHDRTALFRMPFDK